jgi:hypothetical protein
MITVKPSIPRDPPAEATAPRRRTPTLRRVMLWVLFIEVIVAAFFLGLGARRFTWDATQSVRRSEDLCNGWGWGQRALRYGFFKLYDHVIADRPDGDYTLDYTPLRLGIMTAWARWTNHHANGSAGWRADYEFTAPLLHFNTFMELISAVGIFALVRQWASRSSDVPHARFPFPHAKPLAAAVLFWLNPALLLDAHAWPQWDVWPLPFFIFALLAATQNRWRTAGALLAVGAMLKGQLMFVAPLFILWPVFQNNWRGAARVTLAFLLTIAIITAPWTIGQHSMAWFKIGFTYGAAKFPDMAVGAENLAALLQRNFNLQCRDTLLGLPITVKQLLTTSYILTLLLSAKAAARHHAKRDPRFLVAAIMPWLCFFALMTQMHERYLVWAACLSACWLATGPALAALHLLITATAFLIMAQSMCREHPTGWPALTPLLQATAPALAWTVLLSAAAVTLATLTRFPYFTGQGSTPHRAAQAV